MENEQALALVFARSAVLNARVAGMIAENDYCKQVGKTVAYGKDDFEKAIEESGLHRNEIVQMFGGL